MRLEKLFSGVKYEIICGKGNVEITAITYDSRKVVPGALFVCLKGFQVNGHQFIKEAIEAGAAVILVEDVPDIQTQITVIKVNDTREALAYLSAEWFGHPADSMVMIGLTGTKGKTTTAHMVKRILEEAGNKVGMIGTMGAFLAQERIPTKNTTPESYELHSLLARMREAGCRYVVMEVSSQALKLKRTAGIQFDYGAFLNLSPDHIGEGEHKNFDEYLFCKSLLARQARKMIVNIDDCSWKKVTGDAKDIITVSCEQHADLMGNSIKNFWKPGRIGVEFSVAGKIAGNFILNMPGTFNVENALISMAIAQQNGVGCDVMQHALKWVSVKGRTQLLTEAAHFSTILIDYAHNELSMENLLHMLKGYRPGRLICLFGGGGNKPKQRRFDMGKVAGKYADMTIITTDNPRFESVDDINRDIIQGLNVYQGAYQIILDREEAIHYLIDHCKKDDIAVLIGKGHEEYQEIGSTRIFFSEEKIVHDYLMTK